MKVSFEYATQLQYENKALRERIRLLESGAAMLRLRKEYERLLEEKDEFRLMREIIDSLPTLQRTIIRMKDIEEYETEEIAEITGCNAEAIRSNLSRARKKVREVYLQTIQERKRRNKA